MLYYERKNRCYVIYIDFYNGYFFVVVIFFVFKVNVVERFYCIKEYNVLLKIGKKIVKIKNLMYKYFMDLDKI